MIPLPVCRWRGETSADAAECRSNRVTGHDGTVTLAFCVACRVADHDFVPLLSWPPLPTTPVVRRRAACPDLGPPLTTPQMLALGVDPETCGCGGKIRQCYLHDRCTTVTPREGMACCATCKDHPDWVEPSH